MHKRIIFSVILFLTIVLAGGFLYVQNKEGNQTSFNQSAVDPGLSSFSEYYKARVVEISEEEQREAAGNIIFSQTYTVEIISGSEQGNKVEIQNTNTGTAAEVQKVSVGETIVIAKLQAGEETSYVYADKYRMQPILYIVGIFILLAGIFGRSKGLSAIAGLAFSVFVLIYFIVPNIVAGKDAILVSLIGAGLIAIVSIFLAHGVNERTGIATISTLISLSIATALANAFTLWTNLFGLGSSEAFYLQTGLLGEIDLRGLLLAGIIIGTLGILDDVTTSQTAAVEEIHKADPNFKFKELYKRGTSVGREHIASLINTLVLAYAGASFPMFFLFTLSEKQPLWTILNSEFVAEELIRTLIGSSALILAVPISTLIAAFYFTKKHADQNRQS